MCVCVKVDVDKRQKKYDVPKKEQTNFYSLTLASLEERKMRYCGN